MKDLIFNQLTVVIMFLASAYFGYTAFFKMDTKTAFVSLAFSSLAVLGGQIQNRLPK